MASNLGSAGALGRRYLRPGRDGDLREHVIQNYRFPLLLFWQVTRI